MTRPRVTKAIETNGKVARTTNSSGSSLPGKASSIKANHHSDTRM